jgi:ribose transport system permease protein
MAVILAAICWAILSRTVTGRTIYSVGSSEAAAYMSGLPVARGKIAAFAMSGFFAACGGLFFALQTASGNADIPQAGAYTLNSIAAVVLGGTSLMGGTGGAVASLFGALILRTISFSFRILNIDPLIQPLVEGGILLAVVSFGALHLVRVKNNLELFR